MKLNNKIMLIKNLKNRSFNNIIKHNNNNNKLFKFRRNIKINFKSLTFKSLKMRIYLVQQWTLILSGKT